MAEPFLPSHDQELLLRAGFATADAALLAWEEWRRRPGNGGRLPGDARLLPLVHRNLSLQGLAGSEVDEALLPARLETARKGARRRAALAGAIEALRGRGLPSVVLKGAALAQLHYRDWSVRPMTDVDLLVRPCDVPLALEILENRGWRPLEAPPADCVRDPRHATVLQGPASRLDLHWRVLPECPGVGDAAFWDGAVPCAIDGQSTLALQPADQLLHVLSHGCRWSKTGRPGYWVADALTVIRSPVDWQRLAELALQLDLGYVTGICLLYLARGFGAAVPGELLDRLARMQPRWLVRTGHTAEGLAPSRRTLVHALGLHALNYRRLRRGKRVDSGWRGALQALEIAWGTRGLRDTLWTIPMRVLRRGLGWRPGWRRVA